MCSACLYCVYYLLGFFSSIIDKIYFVFIMYSGIELVSELFDQALNILSNSWEI